MAFFSFFSSRGGNISNLREKHNYIIRMSIISISVNDKYMCDNLYERANEISDTHSPNLVEERYSLVG